jgi:GTPase SAR1 family protein
MVHLRILTVGAPKVGKTDAHIGLVGPVFHRSYEDDFQRQQICSNEHMLTINGTDINFSSDERENVRQVVLAYCTPADATYAICMYDVSRPDTLVALEQKFIPFLKKNSPPGRQARFVIVGCKADLRAETDDSCVPLEGFETGKALSLKEQEHGCIGWCEISTKAGTTMMQAIDIIVDDMVTRGDFPKEKKAGCCIVQ